MLNTNKLAVLCFLGMGAIAYGQTTNPYEGRVGINTKTPQATIQVKATEANLAGTTNEGMMAPQLSKTRVAAIATPVEGTLVYVTNETTSPITAYTGADLKVAKIDEKGYYFYNGTEWVKAGASGELWAQRTNNGVTETYLKPASATGKDEFFYTPSRIYQNLGGLTEADNVNNYTYLNETPFLKGVTSDALPQSLANGGTTFPFTYNFSLVKQAHAGSGTSNKSYIGSNEVIKTTDVTSNIEALYGRKISVNANSNNTTNWLVGIQGAVGVGDGTTTSTVNSAIAGQFYATLLRNSTVTSLVGSRSVITNYGGTVTTEIVGSGIRLPSTTLNASLGITTYPTTQIPKMVAQDIFSTIRQNSTVTDYKGIYNQTRTEDGGKATNSYGIHNRSIFAPGSITTTHIAYEAELYSWRGTAQVTDLYGFRLNSNLLNLSSTNMYGLYLGDVNKGSVLNYAIYTNAGNVRIGDLKGTGSRPVYANADGVLIAGGDTSIKIGDTPNIECNDANRGTMNFRKDVTTTNGETSDAFAVCLKGSDGYYYWRYIYGAGGVTNGVGAFGTGL